MAKYRGLAPWALGVTVLAHACASATGLGGRETHTQSDTQRAVRALAEPQVDHTLDPSGSVPNADPERRR